MQESHINSLRSLIFHLNKEPLLLTDAGTQSGGVLHLTWLDHGPEACKILISYIQKMVNTWLLHHGFTCGCADIVANDETMQRVAETLRGAKDKVAETVAKAQRGELDTQPGKTMHQSFEHAVNQSLNSAREEAGRIGIIEGIFL